MKAAPLQKSNVGAAGAGGIKSKLCTTSQIRDFGSGWPPYTNCTNWNRWKISTKTSSSSFITLQITRLLECNWLICVVYFFLLCLALPRPSTGLKMFYSGPNFLGRIKNWSAFYCMEIKFWSGTKCFGLAQCVNQFLVWHRKKLNQPKIFRNL